MYACLGCGVGYQVIATNRCPLCRKEVIDSHHFKEKYVKLSEIEQKILDFAYHAKSQAEMRNRIDVINDLIKELNDTYSSRRK